MQDYLFQSDTKIFFDDRGETSGKGVGNVTSPKARLTGKGTFLQGKRDALWLS